MTELQNIGLVYEAMYTGKDPVFSPDFEQLPESMPYGFWVNQDGAFVTFTSKVGSHEEIIQDLVKDDDYAKKLVTYYGSYYRYAYSVLKLIRVACETLRGKKIMFYKYPDKPKISRKAMDTINDLAMMYDCTLEYDGSTTDP